MDHVMASKAAGRLAASYPGSRITEVTLDSWAEEFQKLDWDRGLDVIEWLRTNAERPPTFRQIRTAMAATRRHESWDPDYVTPGLADPCEFCGQPVGNGPDAASRYDKVRDRWYNAHLGCADAQGR